MNAVAVQNPMRGKIRWWLGVALIFAAHIGLIFAFGDRKPIVPRQPGLVPQFHLALGNDEMLALTDPTLFALPHVNGFSGAAWLRIPWVRPNPFQWSEPPRWLQMPVDQLGTAFSEFMQTNRFARFSPELKSAPKLAMPAAAPAVVSTETASALEIEGELASRNLLNPQTLPSWPAADLLSPCVVRVLVDESGYVISAVVLPPGSGSKEADQRALTIARASKFSALPGLKPNAAASVNRWIPGRMIFKWETVPLSQTNATPVQVQ